MSAPDELAAVADPAQAELLLHPLRKRVLDLLREPRSAADVAAELGLPRQKVNYHVRALADGGLLRKAGQRRKRNFVEQRYVATARSYVLSPAVLGPLAADADSVRDRVSAAHLLALGSQMEHELARAMAEAAAQDRRLSTLSLHAELRFESAAQRTRFTEALRDAIARVVAAHASPFETPDGAQGSGRPYRFVAGCYPVPPNEEKHDDA